MQCLGCKYDLCGLSVSACPECGRAFDPADPCTFSVDGSKRWRLTTDFWIAAGCGAIAVMWLVLVHLALVGARLELGR